MGLSEKKEHLPGLDVFRIMLALLVFCFHSLLNGCSYTRILNPFISMGAISMTGFFMLSGFSLFYNYGDKDLTNLGNISTFYKKRIISVFPIYWIVALVYVLVRVVLKGADIIENIILAPIEFLGIQSAFNSLFLVSHNNGTWFISCIAISYLLFPLIANIIKQLKFKHKLVLFLVLSAIIIYSPFIVKEFNLSGIYDNPFFRSLEFTVGVLLASMMEKLSSMKLCVNVLFHWLSALIEFIIMIILVSIGVILNFSYKNYMMYNFICIPMFSLMLITLSGVRSEVVKKSSIIKYMSSASYVFFLSQLFCWQPTFWILDTLNINNNWITILLSFSVCSVMAVFLHSVLEKPITRFLNKKFIK